VRLGGTVSGEHGVGVEKLDSMCVQFNADELAAMHAVKAAFDPAGGLNPGKAVPTLHSCAEYGREVVRHGAPRAFGDLPRF
jgi:glycolate oxidase